MTYHVPGWSGRRRSTRLVLVATVVTALGLVAASARAQSGECAPGAGITVVVDFAGLGGEVAVGCAPSPSTGFEALAQAGFTATPTQSNQAFVCRINGLPDAETEDCADTPPADAFWSYWVADLGGSWRSSGMGAAGAVAADLEGWSFSGVPPRFTPGPAPTTTTTTTTTTTITTTTSTPTTTTSTSTTTTSTVPPPPTTEANATAATSTTSTTSHTTTTTATTSTSTTAPATTMAQIAPQAGPEEEESTSPAGVVAGVIAIVGLGVAGLVMARRRSDRSDA